MSGKASVLVVDDELHLVETISYILEFNGYEVSTAENGQKAIDLIKEKHFDIILVDVVMPEMNGVDVLRKIKQISPTTQIIVMTGYGREHHLVEEAIGEGIVKLLHKPFDVVFMLNTIEHALGPFSSH